ncbi:unnamed protein product [Prorocentrum cordatum]|uniref:Uncharacterized protein n=1 Tax=Prorocentrum cordatum TaxID=2364126 RepID=A0ABN9VRC3_9DINO|nr:unnamed protein product [Polarella glacialis]
MVFKDSEFDLVSCRTESQQLMAFLMSIRLGAAAHELVITRCRKPPYPTLAALKYPEVLDQLPKQCPNTLDSYTRGFLSFYKADIHGAGARAELTSVDLLADTDTSSTEREHSVQAKKAGSTTTNKKHIMDLSAEVFFSEEMSTGLWRSRPTDKAALRAQPSGCRGDPEDGHQREQVCRMGPWRAFLYCSGLPINPSSMAELSLLYGGLDEEQMQYYEQLGRIMSTVARAGVQLRPQRKRPRIDALPLDDGMPEGSAADEPEDPDADDDRRHATANYKLCMREFRDVLRRERQAHRELTSKQVEIEKEVKAGSPDPATLSATMRSWRLMGAEQQAHFQAEHAHSHSAFVTLDLSTDEALEAAGEAAAEFTQEAASQEWRRLHAQIMTSRVEKLGKVPTTRTQCFEAGYCVCQGDLGKLMRLSVARFRAALRGLKAARGTKKHFKLLVKDVPMLVVKVEAVNGAGENLGSDLWLHVSKYRELPTLYPIFCNMIRLPAEDRHDLIGVAPVQDCRVPDFVDIWAVCRRLLPLDDALNLVFYKLVGQPHVRVLRVTPSRQRVHRLHVEGGAYPAIAIWDGAEAEQQLAATAEPECAAGDDDAASQHGFHSDGGSSAALFMDSDGSADDDLFEEMMRDNIEDDIGSVPSDIDLEEHIDQQLRQFSKPPSSCPGSPVSVSGDVPMEPSAPSSGPGHVKASRELKWNSNAITVNTDHGTIKYYRVTKRLVAELPLAVFNVKTTQERSCNASLHRCRGRPIGYLMAWLMLPNVEGFQASLDVRKRCREMFKAIGGPEVEFILNHGERELQPGEPEEPESAD